MKQTPKEKNPKEKPSGKKTSKEETSGQRLKLESMDIAAEKQDRLKAWLRKTFPEAVSEDKIDFDQLKQALGESDWVPPGRERFGLSWPGKAECMRIIQQPSIATLKPVREQSVDFDITDNLFIEGDNLEVLKLLQRSYFGKVKMIYIDPPYNNGKDFIYPDNYGETLETYLEYTGQKDASGRKFSTNTEQAGRYHSNWLSMMYPRLYLAKNLLRDDGVIFISIDDNEQAHLKALCDHIFGEENFLGVILWKKKTNGNNMGYIPPVHDYFLSYAKNTLDSSSIGFPISEEHIRKNYSNPDNDPRGPWTTSDLSANHKGPHFEIRNPNNGKNYLPSRGRYWVFNEKEVQKRIEDGRIIFGKTGNGKPIQKKFLSDRLSMRMKAESWWDKHGFNGDGTSELSNLFGPKIFDHPKPSITIKNLCNIVTNKEGFFDQTSGELKPDIILDFFAGSCTTAHAVMQLNAEDGGNRRFICVQLPEPCDEKSEAHKAGFKTIADIGTERIRRAAKKIATEHQAKQTKQTAAELNFTDPDNTDQNNTGPVPVLDLGFKFFRLTPSNFKIWNGYPVHPHDKAWKDFTQAEKKAVQEDLVERLKNYVNRIDPAGTPEDILYELLLKIGYPLTTDIERRQMPGGKVYAIQDGALIICLEKKLTLEMMDAIAQEHPFYVICLDEGFQGNDQLKVNAVHTFKVRDRLTNQDIIFRTV